ncbi:protein tramtrack, beta isoform isoform X4 [Bicyclus anynana]|uniref:Protein tramtrack, beta isoform isoform X4 n=1 Tax=Bicyclus anynana TaxID=110368 RepID=A0A6J1NFY8_BICAN|nr:protein tramtrack, beta isoform isoform X4 [Bicyclus anynana]
MASDEQFSLCWNNFHANMSAGFHGLLSRGDLVDVTLAAEGRLLQAHKLVLSVCSPYFQEMFKMNPTQHPIVFLKDVSHSALRDLLQFMYQGEVNVKQEELASFISTAEQLQVKGLTGNQNEESSTPSKPKPTSRPGPRSSQQRQSVMTKLETDLDSKPSSTPVAIKRTNRPSIASNNSSSSQSGPAKRKCVDPLEAGPSGSAKEEFVTIPDEDENNAVAPKMEPEFVNESMWDEDDDGTNNDETNFGEDDSNMEMSGFDGSTTGDGNLTGGGEGGAVGDAQANVALTTTAQVSIVGENQLEIAKKKLEHLLSQVTTQTPSCEGGGKQMQLGTVSIKKLFMKDASIQVLIEQEQEEEEGKVLAEGATANNSTHFHTLRFGSKHQNCTVCFNELRNLMSKRAAVKKVKKTTTFCVECNINMCCYCFKTTHPITK